MLKGQILVAGQAGTWPLNVRICQSLVETQNGLQGSSPLNDSEGMVFPFDQVRPARFHMGTVQFPIDIIWIRDGQVIRIITAQPGVKDHWETIAGAVLEVRGGWCKDHGVVQGDQIMGVDQQIPGIPMKTARCACQGKMLFDPRRQAMSCVRCGQLEVNVLRERKEQTSHIISTHLDDVNKGWLVTGQKPRQANNQSRDLLRTLTEASEEPDATMDDLTVQASHRRHIAQQQFMMLVDPSFFSMPLSQQVKFSWQMQHREGTQAVTALLDLCEDGASQDKMASVWSQLASKLDFWERDAVVRAVVEAGFPKAVALLKTADSSQPECKRCQVHHRKPENCPYYGKSDTSSGEPATAATTPADPTDPANLAAAAAKATWNGKPIEIDPAKMSDGMKMLQSMGNSGVSSLMISLFLRGGLRTPPESSEELTSQCNALADAFIDAGLLHEDGSNILLGPSNAPMIKPAPFVPSPFSGPFACSEGDVNAILQQHGAGIRRVVQAMTHGLDQHEAVLTGAIKEAWLKMSVGERALQVNGTRMAKYFTNNVLNPEEADIHSHLTQEWKIDSGSDGAQQIHGLAKVMGVSGSMTPKDEENASSIEAVRAAAVTDPKLQSYIKKAYTFTQAVLTQLGVQELTLYRGVSGTDLGKKPLGTEVSIQCRELSSYSQDPTSAKNFGDVIEMKVPASSVFGCQLIHSGYRWESEVAVLGASDLVGRTYSPVTKTAGKKDVVHVPITDENENWLRDKKKPLTVRDACKQAQTDSQVDNSWARTPGAVRHTPADQAWSGNEIPADTMGVGTTAPSEHWDQEIGYDPSVPSDELMGGDVPAIRPSAGLTLREAFLMRAGGDIHPGDRISVTEDSDGLKSDDGGVCMEVQGDVCRIKFDGEPVIRWISKDMLRQETPKDDILESEDGDSEDGGLGSLLGGGLGIVRGLHAVSDWSRILCTTNLSFRYEPYCRSTEGHTSSRQCEYFSHESRLSATSDMA